MAATLRRAAAVLRTGPASEFAAVAGLGAAFYAVLVVMLALEPAR